MMDHKSVAKMGEIFGLLCPHIVLLFQFLFQIQAKEFLPFQLLLILGECILHFHIQKIYRKQTWT